MRTRLRAGLLILTLAVAALGGSTAAESASSTRHARGVRHAAESHVRHVLLISVDGLHQSDLSWFVAKHPHSTLAHLTHGGLDYTQARTPVPSDSFPGMVGQVTGGNPRTTGVYYDAEYNHTLLPAGTSSCSAGQPIGAEVNYFEVIAKNPLAIDSGQGLPGLPHSILQLTGTPSPLLINPKALPVDPTTCKPIYPHQYIKVNTIFEIARQHGLRTAWSDKHVAYEILNGRSGTGIQDLFAPEINSVARQRNGSQYPSGGDWTTDNSWTMRYDTYKVHAVLNEIDGFDHSGSRRVGTPAIFGMNFQTVSTAQKLPVSDGLNGGYRPGTTTPGPLLTRALNYINTSVAAIVRELHERGLSASTAIIISAKHAQSPMNPNALTRIDDAAIITALNQAWSKDHPGAGNLVAADPGNLAAGSRDDAFPLWLNDRSQQAADFARAFLWSHPATGTTYNAQKPAAAGPPRTLPHSGLKAIYAGAAAAHYFAVPATDPRHPDLWGVVSHGVVYTGGAKKIAEHGGADLEDRNVPILVYAPNTTRGQTSHQPVETTQIAPTILRLLHLDPKALEAVRIEGTQVLPGF